MWGLFTRCSVRIGFVGSQKILDVIYLIVGLEQHNFTIRNMVLLTLGRCQPLNAGKTG